MWNSLAKLKRLKKALEYRGLNPEKFNINNLFDVLMKRSTDNKLNHLVYSIIAILEPSQCYMTHCKNRGGQSSFCNCAAGIIPGKCSIYRAYKKRKKAKDKPA